MKLAGEDEARQRWRNYCIEGTYGGNGKGDVRIGAVLLEIGRVLNRCGEK